MAQERPYAAGVAIKKKKRKGDVKKRRENFKNIGKNALVFERSF